MAHAARSGTEGGGFLSLDLEFSGHSAGVSFVKMPSSSEAGSIIRLAKQFPGTSWNLGEPTICQCCRDFAQQRAESPQLHPLFGILQHAHFNGTPLDIRLHPERVEIASLMPIQNLLVNDGYLIITDAAVHHHQPASAAMHVDLTMDHSFSIVKKRIDDVPQMSLIIFDMHGNRNFTISSEVEAAEKNGTPSPRRWMNCTAATISIRDGATTD